MGSDNGDNGVSPHYVSISNKENKLEMVPGTINSQIQAKSDKDIIEKSINKSNHYGDHYWVSKNIDEFDLGQTLRKVGRPRLLK